MCAVVVGSVAFVALLVIGGFLTMIGYGIVLLVRMVQQMRLKMAQRRPVPRLITEEGAQA